MGRCVPRPPRDADLLSALWPSGSPGKSGLVAVPISQKFLLSVRKGRFPTGFFPHSLILIGFQLKIILPKVKYFGVTHSDPR